MSPAKTYNTKKVRAEIQDPCYPRKQTLHAGWGATLLYTIARNRRPEKHHLKVGLLV